MAYPTTSPNWDPFLSAMSGVDSAVSAVGTVQAGDPVVLENYTDLRTAIVELSDALDALRDGSFYAPVGLIAPFGGAVGEVPTGWLLCNGAAVSQTTYASLYAVVGANAFGSDGGGNFYLPDLRGRVVAGVDFNNSDTSRLYTANNSAATRGQVIGDYRLQEHTHTYSGTTGSGDWLAAYNHYGPLGGSSAYPVSTSEAAGRTIQGAGGGHTHSFSGTTANHNKSQGSAQNVQPTMMLNYIIKW